MAKTHSYDSGMRILTALEFLQNLPEPEPGKTSVQFTVKDLVDYFAQNGISANRSTAKSILDAIYERDTGFPLERRKSDKGQDQYYYHRAFSLEQLSMLSTIICSSIFLNESEIDKLLKQVRTLTSEENSQFLPSSYDFLRPRMMNEFALSNLRTIYEAIHTKTALRFYRGSIDSQKHSYYNKPIRGNTKKYQHITFMPDPDGIHYTKKEEELQLKPKQNISPIICFPYSLAWDNSRCYLICGRQDEDNDKVYVWNYRVDRMFEAKLYPKCTYRDPISSPYYDIKKHRINAEQYLHSMFKMFTSKEQPKSVTLRFKTSLTRVIVERFGFDTKIQLDNEGYATITVTVQITRQFYSWLAGYRASDLRIIAPQNEVDGYLRYLRDIIEHY